MNISEDEWRQIYPRLYAYADFLLKSNTWFRSRATNSYIKGKEVKDYVMEAITFHLTHSEKYDGTKRGLVQYLKKHIIRSLVGNDVRCLENKTTDAKISGLITDPERMGDLVGPLLPHIQVYFQDEIDYQSIIAAIRKELAVDPEAASLFELVSIEGILRREVLALYGWTGEKYDNAMKRLRRITYRVACDYNIIPKDE